MDVNLWQDKSSWRMVSESSHRALTGCIGLKIGPTVIPINITSPWPFLVNSWSLCIYLRPASSGWEGMHYSYFFSKKKHQELPYPPLKRDYGSVIKSPYVSYRKIKLSFKHLSPTAHNHCNSSPMGYSILFPASPSLPRSPPITHIHTHTYKV